MPIKKHLLVLLMLVIIATTITGCLNKTQVYKPYLVMIEQDPWSMVIGSDSPTFALYDDGLTIFCEKNEGYKSVILSKQERDSFRIDKDFLKLKDYYEVVSAMDQSYISLYVWGKGKQKKIDVYGGPIRFEKRFKKFEEDIKIFRSRVPNEFLRIYDNITVFNHSKAQKWLPEKIEIMVFPNDDSTEEPYPWPENWPNIKTSGTKKREELYSVYLDSSHYSELMKIIKENSTVFMNGHKWSIFYRFPFPNEELWMK